MSMRRTPPARIGQYEGHWSYGTPQPTSQPTSQPIPHSVPSWMPHHSKPSPVLELAYVLYTGHNGDDYFSWAFLYDNRAYIESFQGDIWLQYQVLISQPVREGNNPLIQKILDKFYPGWGEDAGTDQMGQTLRRLKYRLPFASNSVLLGAPHPSFTHTVQSVYITNGYIIRSTTNRVIKKESKALIHNGQAWTTGDPYKSFPLGNRSGQYSILTDTYKQIVPITRDSPADKDVTYVLKSIADSYWEYPKGFGEVTQALQKLGYPIPPPNQEMYYNQAY